MHILLDLIGFLSGHAHAAGTIDTLGEGAPGISEMWQQILAVFPASTLGHGSGGFAYLMGKIIRFILESIAALAVAMIIYAGIKMITGGEEGLGEGKKIVQYAALGLICAMVADAVVIYTMTVISAAAS